MAVSQDGAIAALVADDQVRRRVRVRPAVDLRREINGLHGRLAGSRVDQRPSLPGDFPAQGGGFGPLGDNALRLPALEVHEHAGQADGEGPRLAPIDRGQVFL